jgi:hypothetical protein
VKLLKTPIRRLEGIAYWVIADPEAIHDFINTEVRKEWEADARSEGRDPGEDNWLTTLSRREWSLTVLGTSSIRLDPEIMNYVNRKTGYNFKERVVERSEQLRREIEEFGHVIWPVIVNKEGMLLVDGYCRYVTLESMGVQRIYAYIGTMVPT